MMLDDFQDFHCGRPKSRYSHPTLRWRPLRPGAVAGLRTMMAAPEITPPLESVIVPFNCPLPTPPCACAELALTRWKTVTTKKNSRAVNLPISPPPRAVSVRSQGNYRVSISRRYQICAVPQPNPIIVARTYYEVCAAVNSKVYATPNVFLD